MSWPFCYLCLGHKVLPMSWPRTEAVRVHHPDIVLSDIGLPNRDGFQLLQEIRSLDVEQGRDIPVIAMTAFRWSGQRAQSLWGGFQTRLEKPFKPDQLLSAVASTLDNRH